MPSYNTAFKMKTVFLFSQQLQTLKENQDLVSIQRPSFSCMGIPMLKIRRSRDRLIFNMGIPILVRRHLYIETAPRTLSRYKDGLSRHGDLHYKDKSHEIVLSL